MPIRLKILIGCLGFLTIVVSLGLFTRVQSNDLGDLAMNVYDNALIGVSYVHKVQTDFVRLAADERDAAKPFSSAAAQAQLKQIGEDLDVAIERAITKKGKAKAVALKARIQRLRNTMTPQQARIHLVLIDQDLGKLVRKYTADGFIYRVRAERLVARTDLWLWVALIACAAMSVVITLLLGHAIVPPLKRAVGIAKEIATGNLNNQIAGAGGRSETDQLLSALAQMQDAIAQSARRKEALRKAELARIVAEKERYVAIEANKTKTNFLANMSHELRTPLNAIIGFSDLILQETHGAIGNARYKTYINDIHRSGGHLLALINDILDLSRLDAGQATLQEEAVGFEPLVRDVCKFVELQAADAGVALVIGVPADLPLLKADVRRLKQILLNLISNSVKFTPAGGQVDIQARIGSEGFAIVVSDTGIGIAKADIPKALEQFGQIDNGLSRRYEGSGLGLPLTKKLTELHGGTFLLESTVGVGTTVTVTFPGSRIISADVAAASA